MSKAENFSLVIFILLEFIATRHGDTPWLLVFAGMAGGMFVMLPLELKE